MINEKQVPRGHGDLIARYAHDARVLRQENERLRQRADYYRKRYEAMTDAHAVVSGLLSDAVEHADTLRVECEGLRAELADAARGEAARVTEGNNGE